MHVENNNCPCCGNPLLRHIRQRGVYWFCTSCWQEVPVLAISKLPSKQESINKPVIPVGSKG